MSELQNPTRLMEAPLNTQVRLFVYPLVLVMGLALIVGGIVAAKYGAVVIGIVVSGVSAQQFLKTYNATKDKRLGHPH